jgi:hypothetical protein
MHGNSGKRSFEPLHSLLHDHVTDRGPMGTATWLKAQQAKARDTTGLAYCGYRVLRTAACPAGRSSIVHVQLEAADLKPTEQLLCRS